MSELHNAASYVKQHDDIDHDTMSDTELVLPPRYSNQLQVQYSALKGNALYTQHDISSGTSIAIEDSYIDCLNGSHINTTCQLCWKQVDASQLYQCSQCKLVKYCSKLCQSDHWSSHRLECYILTQTVNSRTTIGTSPTLWLILRLLLKQLTTGSVPSYQSKMYQQLITNSDQLSNQRHTEYTQMATLVQAMLCKLLHAVQDTAHITHVPSALRRILQQLSVELLQQLCDVSYIVQQLCRVACNCITITDSELRPLGIGIYPMLSTINHSCQPNCAVMFTVGHSHPTTATIRSLCPIEKGQELTIPYIDIGDTVIHRQHQLKQQYYFTCQCTRCVYACTTVAGKKLEAAMTEYRRSTVPCNCTVPDQSNDETEPKHHRYCEKQFLHLSDEIDTFTKRNRHSHTYDKQLFIFATQAVSQLVDVVDVEYNIQLLHLLDILSHQCIDNELWSDALIYHTAALRIMLHVYPSIIHPVIGLQHFLIAKLCWLVIRTDEAVYHWRAARSILSITHGSTHKLLDSIDVSIQEAFCELQYKADSNSQIILQKLQTPQPTECPTVNTESLTKQLKQLCEDTTIDNID